MAKDKPEFTAKMSRMRKSQYVDDRADELENLLFSAIDEAFTGAGFVQVARTKTGYDVQYDVGCFVAKESAEINLVVDFNVTAAASGKSLARLTHKLDVPLGSRGKTPWPDMYVKDFRKSSVLKKLTAAAQKDAEANGGAK